MEVEEENFLETGREENFLDTGYMLPSKASPSPKKKSRQLYSVSGRNSIYWSKTFSEKQHEEELTAEKQDLDPEVTTQVSAKKIVVEIRK